MCTRPSQHWKQASSHPHFLVIFRRVTNCPWESSPGHRKERRRWPRCSIHPVGERAQPERAHATSSSRIGSGSKRKPYRGGEALTATGRQVEANALNYLLIPLRLRHDRSLAPDVHAIEEAHAEQGDGQVVALHDDCVGVMNGDVANAHGVELENASP